MGKRGSSSLASALTALNWGPSAFLASWNRAISLLASSTPVRRMAHKHQGFKKQLESINMLW